MSNNKELDKYVEKALLFVLGVLAGVAIKVEADKSILIGHDDYRMKFSVNQYKINDLQRKINAEIFTEERETASQDVDSNEQNEEANIQNTEQ